MAMCRAINSIEAAVAQKQSRCCDQAWPQRRVRDHKANKMKTSMTILGGLLAVTGLMGCASTKQSVAMPDQGKTVEDVSKGRIYVMQSPFAFNIASHHVPVPVWQGNREIGVLVGRAYLCWEQEPGTVEISCGTRGSRGVSLRVEAGKVYYVIQYIGPDWRSMGPMTPPGGGELATKLEVVSEEVGLKLLKKCKPAAASK